MRGHVRKRGEKFIVIIDHGRDPHTKKRQQSWHSGFTSEKAAERELTRLLAAKDAGEPIEKGPTRLAFGAFLVDQWLPHITNRVEAGNMRPSTADFYRQLIEAYVLPGLAAVRLRSLDAPMLNRFYGELLRSGRKTKIGQPQLGLSPTTVHHVHVTIGKALRDAERWGLLARNVATLADPPRPTRTERTLWTHEQVATFLEATQSDRLGAAWLVLATTGLRRGELAALHWRDVDLEAATLTVSGSRVSIRYKVVESQPKTDKSRRTITLAPSVVKELRVHRKRQLEERLAWPDWVDTDLLFIREDGTPFHPEYLTWLFQRTARRVGLPTTALHSLRHYHATAGLQAGVPLLTMSRRLGHSSIQVTADVYSHTVQELDQQAAELTAGLLRVTAK